jgi:multiple sugar transport system substrate-binding protein
LVGDAAISLTQTYNGFPARMSLQAGAVSHLQARYTGVDWQVLVDSIDYMDNPNHEGYMPNHAKAQERVDLFLAVINTNPGVNINNALNDLKEDLQIIFHERKVFLPLIVQ